jgi:hypothetical protein
MVVQALFCENHAKMAASLVGGGVQQGCWALWPHTRRADPLRPAQAFPKSFWSLPRLGGKKRAEADTQLRK